MYHAANWITFESLSSKWIIFDWADDRPGRPCPGVIKGGCWRDLGRRAKRQQSASTTLQLIRVILPFQRCVLDEFPLTGCWLPLVTLISRDFKTIANLLCFYFFYKNGSKRILTPYPDGIKSDKTGNTFYKFLVHPVPARLSCSSTRIFCKQFNLTMIFPRFQLVSQSFYLPP